MLRFVAGGAVLPMLGCNALIGDALALDYPTRPVHIIVGFPAGTSSDITARLVAQRLSERLYDTLNFNFIHDIQPVAGGPLRGRLRVTDHGLPGRAKCLQH